METNGHISLGKALRGARCPKCREGRMFRSAPYDVRHFARMHSECPRCGQDFRIEPGFYMGSSYIHYALCVVVIFACLGVYFLFFSTASELLFIAFALLANLLVLPFGFRMSRVLMLHFFGGVQYEPTVLLQTPPLIVGSDGHLRGLGG
jgi:uncharacterized protein (DUF983 family)